MARTFSFILLFAFGLSILLFPVLEGGHEILHHIENDFHHHDADHHHTIADHHVKYHHDEDEASEESEMLDYISFLVGFYSAIEMEGVVSLNLCQHHHTAFISFYRSLVIAPPTNPPLK